MFGAVLAKQYLLPRLYPVFIQSILPEKDCEALSLFSCGLQSVQPTKMLRDAVTVSGNELVICGKHKFPINKNVHVIGFGKAALGMVTTVLDILKKHVVDSVVSCPEPKNLKEAPRSVTAGGSINMVFYGPSTNESNEQVLEASVAMAEKAEKLTANDLLLVCITGGGSALSCLPRLGLAPQDVWATTKLLSQAGATIHQLNAVRAQLEVLKAGGLARLAAPAQTVSLILSDVIGDPLPVIASGPTIATVDPLPHPLSIFDQLGITDSIPPNLRRWLVKSPNKPGATSYSTVHATFEPNFREPWSWDEKHLKCPAPVNIILGNNRAALNASRDAALKKTGFKEAVILTDRLEGNADDRATQIAVLIHTVRRWLARGDLRSLEAVMEQLRNTLATWPLEPDVFGELQRVLQLAQNSGDEKPLCLLLGGETTVRVPLEFRKSGLGGRCTHMALSTAVHLEQMSAKETSPSPVQIQAVFGASDGLDGPTDGAGAWIDSDLCSKARSQGMEPKDFLTQYNSYTFFKQLDQGHHLITTGLTGTNVMDLLVFTFKRNKK